MVIDPKDLTVIAETNFRNMRKKFGIKRDDRRRHIYVIGKSGSGKSVLLENMIMQDIMNGNGCCVMDPHGDLAEAIVKCIPPERQNDIVYFNPSDVNYPVAFNILEGAQSDSSKNLVTSGLIGIFKKIWADSWGPRLEYVLRNTILSLMYAEGSTLLGINRMLVDKKYRNSVLEKVHDPIIKAFWTQEYENYPAKELPTIISPIQNKVGQFLSNPIVRNILGQANSTMDLREIMDKKKIFLVNLSKGRIGEDNSSLIGSMLVTKLYLAAMSRVDIPEHERNDFYLYVDEFQNFATDSFADILSEARKYRLALTIAHQYVLQLPEKVADAIFGNGGTLITFRLGPQDAEIFEKEFGPDFVLEDLVNIPKYNIVLKLLIDGVASKPFSAATLPPMTKNSGYEDRSAIIIEESRKRYARSIEFVEKQIRDWSMSEDEKKALERKEKEDKAKKEAQEKGETIVRVDEKNYITNCWVCGMEMSVPFAPDDKRPIYCVDDLKKVREKIIPEPKENRFVKKKNNELVKNEQSRNTETKEKKNENIKNVEKVNNNFDKNNNQNKNKDNKSEGNKQNNNSQKQQNNNQNKQNSDKNLNNKNSQQNNKEKNNNHNNQKSENANKIDKKEKDIVLLQENKIKENFIESNNSEILKIDSNSDKNILIENKKEELILINPEVKPLLIEDGSQNKKEEIKNELESHKEINFKDILNDIISENGITVKTKKEDNVEIKNIKEEFLDTSSDELNNSFDLDLSEQEVLNEKEEDKKEEIKTNSKTLSLNKLKEKSFEEIKEELNQKNNNNRKTNILKAGEVIKL